MYVLFKTLKLYNPLHVVKVEKESLLKVKVLLEISFARMNFERV